ncbi:hypothetical protein MNBD_GAMMA09-361 [hydrothermal vent metagenome]|uniref:TIGR02444 family protein n=1 Tax=hydrothermal vent metagenome TaxID=652676 RepID=A0A3B0XCM0_9ZZZZ
MEFPNSSFWQYSTQIWSLPEVEPACLNLQNSFGLNVNMLLYSCWIGEQSLCLSDDDLQTLLDSVKPWQTIIQPLRDSRKMMQQNLIAMPTGMVNQTIKNISEMELNAEHMAQLAMEKALNLSKLPRCPDKSPLNCSESNIHAYLKTLDNNSAIDEIKTETGRLLCMLYGDNK